MKTGKFPTTSGCFGLKELVQDTDKIVSKCGPYYLKSRLYLRIMKLDLIPEIAILFLGVMDFWPAEIAMFILFFSQIKKKSLKIYWIVYS